jgi:hypothetical protein
MAAAMWLVGAAFMFLLSGVTAPQNAQPWATVDDGV